jgi:hypothetical protein
MQNVRSRESMTTTSAAARWTLIALIVPLGGCRDKQLDVARADFIRELNVLEAEHDRLADQGTKNEQWEVLESHRNIHRRAAEVRGRIESIDSVQPATTPIPGRSSKAVEYDHRLLKQQCALGCAPACDMQNAADPDLTLPGLLGEGFAAEQERIRLQQAAARDLEAMRETMKAPPPCADPNAPWAYDDKSGTTIVVDRLAQVPKDRRKTARCVRAPAE